MEKDELVLQDTKSASFHNSARSVSLKIASRQYAAIKKKLSHNDLL